MFVDKVLVVEFLAIDRSSSSSVVVGKVTSLAHELGDDSVKARTFVAKAFFAGAESAEVLGGFWHISVESDNGFEKFAYIFFTFFI